MRRASDAGFATLSRALPFSLKKAAEVLHEHFRKYMEVEDLDAKTAANVHLMFQHEEEEIGKIENAETLLPSDDHSEEDEKDEEGD